MIKLAKQSLYLFGDSRNDRVVEDEGQGCQQKSAQHHGDDDFDRVTNVEIAALVGKSHADADRVEARPIRR